MTAHYGVSAPALNAGPPIWPARRRPRLPPGPLR